MVSKAVAIIFIVFILYFPSYGSGKDFRFGHPLPKFSLTHVKVFVPFSEKVKEDTNGEITISIYSMNLLGSGIELLDSIERGGVDMGFIFPSNILGGLIINENKVKVLWRGELNESVLFSRLELKNGLNGKVIGCTNKKAMEKVLFLGGTPQYSTISDLYTNLEKKITDGEIAPIDSAIAFRLRDVSKFIYFGEFGREDYIMIMNRPSYDSLSLESKRILDKLGKLFGERQKEEYSKYRGEVLEELKKSGMKIIQLKQ